MTKVKGFNENNNQGLNINVDYSTGNNINDVNDDRNYDIEEHMWLRYQQQRLPSHKPRLQSRCWRHWNLQSYNNSHKRHEGP